MLPRTPATLERWSKIRPGTKMPSTIDELNATEQLMLQERDYEFYQLLSGQAPAELELAVQRNEWSADPPDMQVLAEQARNEQIARLTEQARSGNQTALFMLKGMDEMLGQQVQDELMPTPEQLRAAAEDAAERDRSMREQSLRFAVGAAKAANTSGVL